MKPSLHLHLFCLVTTLWTLFFFGGLWSDYYQLWHWLWQFLIVDFLPGIFMIYIAPRLIRNIRTDSEVSTGWILAAYFSIPFLLYDFIYLFCYKQEPLSYLLDYWYLTFFSFIPWIIFPLAAKSLRLNSRPAR